MILTVEQVRFILEEIAWQTVFDNGRTRLQEKMMGNSEDAELRKLQIKLSIMLETKTKAAELRRDS